MNFIVENWYLFLLALVSGGGLLLPMLKSGANGLSPAAAVLLVNREKAVLIDVCGPDEYAERHVGGAKNVPVNDIEARLPAVVKNKSVPVVMVCASGARATRAAIMARRMGYQNVQVLAGGTKAWQEAGLPIDKKA
ncbi:rhodanese-like domain-containing protein [Comamonas granuli]|uniref:rhodanese-like domain-containing protein n=1 Tax=Comamonas granuli TaxID=290309 RepID=UPI0005A73222|nr:rhodanese-like domain-containing protein [Comamonas granuli]